MRITEGLGYAATPGLRRFLAKFGRLDSVSMESYWLRAEINAGPLWSESGEVDPDGLPLSQRLLVAIADWGSFFSESAGDLSDPDTAEEFVGQGFKLAYALRRELKGRNVFYHQPVTGEQIAITRKPR